MGVGTSSIHLVLQVYLSTVSFLNHWRVLFYCIKLIHFLHRNHVLLHNKFCTLISLKLSPMTLIKMTAQNFIIKKSILFGWPCLTISVAATKNNYPIKNIEGHSVTPLSPVCLPQGIPFRVDCTVFIYVAQQPNVTFVTYLEIVIKYQQKYKSTQGLPGNI